MKLIPVYMYPRKGNWILLRNFAMGHLVWIECVYIVGRHNSARQAKKVASALNRAIAAMEPQDYFSTFCAEVSHGEFPVGAKVLDVPLRVATLAAAKEWVTNHLPEPICGDAYDNEAMEEQLYDRMFPHWGIASNSLFDGKPCSVE